MAIRELFARFSFAWDQSVLAKITAASVQAESKVRGVGRAFDAASASANEAKAALTQASAGPTRGLPTFTRGILGARLALGRTVDRLRAFGVAGRAALTEAWWQVFAGDPSKHATPVLNRVRAGIGSVLGSLQTLGSRWRGVFAGSRVLAGQAVASFRQAAASANEASKKIDLFGSTLGQIGPIGGAFGAVFAGRAILSGIKNTLDQADATRDLSQQLGVSVEALQGLEAASNMSGLSSEDLSVSFRTMTRNLGLFAATGKGRVKDVLKEMGAGVDDIEGRSPDQLFWQFGKAIAGIEDPVRRSAFAQRIFGDSGAKMLTMFRGSAADIDKLKASTEELGIVFSSEFADQADEVNDQLYLAGLQFQRIKVSIVGSVAPAMLWISGRAIMVGQALARLTGQSNILQGSFAAGGWMLFVKLLGRLFTGVGGIRGALVKLWPALLAIGRVLLPWLAWSLILDDIMTFLQGGDSLLGRFLDSMFGAGAAAATLAEIRSRWAGIVEWLQRALVAVRDWSAGTNRGVKTAIVALTALGLAATTTLGQMILKLIGATTMLAIHAGQVLVTAGSWAVAQVSALALSGSMGAMAVAAGAAAAAIVSIWAAWDQGQKLLSEVGGWEGLLAGMKTLAGGEGLFAGIDATANAKARAEAAARRRNQLVAEGGTVERAGALGRGTRAAPEPTLPGGGSSRVVALTDQRTVNVTVAGGANPAATGRAVAGAVAGAPSPVANPRALRGALVGAGRD